MSKPYSPSRESWLPLVAGGARRVAGGRASVMRGDGDGDGQRDGQRATAAPSVCGATTRQARAAIGGDWIVGYTNVLDSDIFLETF